eukprot:CAMPEP_0118862948 /NCGR_PEP_ID=MMETSP1163-20130328/7994_1 /TAXON_ID=124430 /ORGANISM="Phaeomonas parva, Strain CCMP2877" /LENGTH=226 /DNA_ID=CAMNT_0006796909 /DNA_START=65 /DNA_END=745 /DNA_ORIENTATION=-
MATVAAPAPGSRPGKIEAWYYNDDGADQRLPHKYEPNRPVPLEKLTELGVIQWALDADKYEDDAELEAIREERGYSYKDVITVSPEKLPGYEEKIKSFFEEHIHTDEEIRYVLDGTGYFDVRDENDEWIRIFCGKGDMIVLPEGMYHRFTMDEQNYIKAMRLFVGEPVWTPYNRPQEDNPSRTKYVNAFLSGGENKAEPSEPAEKRPRVEEEEVAATTEGKTSTEA